MSGAPPRPDIRERIARAKSERPIDREVERTVSLGRGSRLRYGTCPNCGGRQKLFVNPVQGTFGCFRCGEAFRGDVIEWVRRRDGCDFMAALDHLLGEAEVPVDPAAREREATRRAERAERDAQAAIRSAERRVALAAGLWSAARPAYDTITHDYLVARGCWDHRPPPAAIRHLDRATWPAATLFGVRDPAMSAHPALIARIEDSEGGFRGVQVIYLADDGHDRLRRDAAKPMIGRVRGGFVPLFPPSRTMIGAEGIETALACTLVSGLPALAMLSVGNLDAPLPAAARRYVIAADADESTTRRLDRLGRPLPTGRDMAEAARQKAAAAQRARGVAVTVARPPAGMDFLSWKNALQQRAAAGAAREAWPA